MFVTSDIASGDVGILTGSGLYRGRCGCHRALYRYDGDQNITTKQCGETSEMAVERFNIVFNGQVAAGFAPEQVKQSMASQFHLKDEQLETLFSGRPVVLKRGLSRAQAIKFRSLLAKVGALGLVREESPGEGAATRMPPNVPQAASEPAAPEKEPAAAAAGPDPEAIDCPRCGHNQAPTMACGLCKMDLRLHLQRLAKRQRLRRRY